MRLKEREIEYTAWRILRKLKDKDEIILFDAEEATLEHLKTAIVEELQKEDDLNREVEEQLVKHQAEIERESVDYRRMFQLVKRELAKKKGMVL